MQSNSFIAYRLTGEFTQDRSQGYGLQCYDIQKGRWDLSMCDRMGIDPKKLPKLFDCHEIMGTVTAKAAVETGLPEGTPVAAGGLDAACGTWEPGGPRRRNPGTGRPGGRYEHLYGKLPL